MQVRLSSEGKEVATFVEDPRGGALEAGESLGDGIDGADGLFVVQGRFDGGRRGEKDETASVGSVRDVPHGQTVVFWIAADRCDVTGGRVECVHGLVERCRLKADFGDVISSSGRIAAEICVVVGAHCPDGISGDQDERGKS